ncbi:MAG: hypothetical protein ACO1N0_02805 [Fluviicola sp.]
MKSNIIRLIKDDIKISRLVNTLERLQVSAHQYSLGNSGVIFSLMGVPAEEQNLDLYYKLIEQGEDVTKYNTNEKIEELAEEIFRQLIVF